MEADELRATHRVFSGTGRLRGLPAFLPSCLLDQRKQLVTSPPRRNRHEAFVQRTIAALPPRISGELGTGVGVLRSAGTPHVGSLICLTAPLADWTTVYTTLSQVR